MIGNNSSGSHSIVYGTTIDHVHALEVVLADGSTARFGPVDEAERARRAEADTLEGAIYRGLPEILRDHARAIAEDYPRHWRQSGGYRLDRLAREFDLARFVTGSEGTLVAITEATVGLIELPKAKQFVVGHFQSVDEAVAATQDALDLEPAAVEMIDATILELSRSKREYAQMARDDPGRARRAAVRDVLRRHARRGGRPARPPRGRLARARPRLPHAARRDRRRAGRADQGPQGRPRAC